MMDITAGAPIVPDGGFSAARYASLWTQSPFALATAESAGGSSPDYALVGVAHFDGVDYADLVEKKSQRHLVVYSGAVVDGLTLVSLSHRSASDGGTSAVLTKDGETIQLRMNNAPLAITALPAPGAPVQTTAAVFGNRTRRTAVERARPTDPEHYVIASPDQP